MGEAKGKSPLRDWIKNSYDEEGRSCSGLDPENKSYDRQIPKLPDEDREYNPSGSGDSGRRNK